MIQIAIVEDDKEILQSLVSLLKQDTDIFILKGQGEETFMPRFNYKGFHNFSLKANGVVTNGLLNRRSFHESLPDGIT